MKGKNIIFNDEKIRKSNINVNKMLISKKEPYGQKIYLSISLDVMMVVSLDHYV